MEESELARKLEIFDEAIRAKDISAAREVSDSILSHQLFGQNQNDHFEVLNQLARLEHHSGNSQSAIEHYLDIVELGKEHKQAAWQAHGFKHIGMINSEKFELETAEVYLTKALNIYRLPEFQSSLPLANTLREIALLKKKKCELMTQSLWEEALEIYKEKGIEAGVEECLEKLHRN